ncbi:MAG: hypothetical protein IKX36_11065 [Prevotella sp.]|nr:hypothetical protein [Prevotella sp.]
MGAVLNIYLPTSWASLTDKQLLMVYSLFARDLSAPEVKTLCLMKWNKLEVLYKHSNNTYCVKQRRKHFFHPPRGRRGRLITSSQIQAATSTLDFLDSFPPEPIRLSHIGRHRALPADFEGVPFEKYLYLENLFQGVLHMSSNNGHTSTLLNSQTPKLLKDMSQVLYDCDNIKPSQAQLVSVFYWFASLKQYFARLFPHFFQPLNDQTTNLLAAQSLFDQLRDSTNAQIRALTGGDITKEVTIKQLDTWRALTELDAQAREAEEYRKASKS